MQKIFTLRHNSPSLIEELQGFHRSEDENPYISPVLFHTKLATFLSTKIHATLIRQSATNRQSPPLKSSKSNTKILVATKNFL